MFANTDISHIIIRDPSYVAGTANKPDSVAFIQTNKKSKPIDTNKLAYGQTIWMKWSGGPIVASSKIVSWHTGNFQSGNINEIRELCIGTPVFGATKYWKTVASKIDGYYAVILLSDEKWLEQPKYPASTSRSHGRSWIYVDTAEKADAWLTNNIEQQVKENNPKGRGIPVGLRFEVMKRDNWTCQIDGRRKGEEYPDLVIEVDHKIPWSKLKVKEHTLDNLQVLCWDCNRGKSNKII